MNLFSSQSLTVAGIWVAAFTFLGILIRQIGPWKRQADAAEALLRSAMAARIDTLEVRLELQEAHHRVETTLNNHQLRNITACFDAMLLLLEMNPDRGPEIVEKIKQMRATQMIAEAEEKAILRSSLLMRMGGGAIHAVSEADVAERAAEDAKQTVRSTTATFEGVKAAETKTGGRVK